MRGAGRKVKVTDGKASHWAGMAGDRGLGVRESSREGEECLHLAPTVFVPSLLAEQCCPLSSPNSCHII